MRVVSRTRVTRTGRRSHPLNGTGEVRSDPARAVAVEGKGCLSLAALARTLRVLADPTRLQILDSLLDGIQCNCNIKAMLGLPMNLISHHLKILKEAGFVHAQRDSGDARWIYYQIEPEALESLRNALSAALDPVRLKPRGDQCGPLGCCPPRMPARKPRPASSRRSAPFGSGPVSK